MAIKTPPILPELVKFVETIGADVPYEKLLQTATEAGWQYRLVQKDAQLFDDGNTLLTFDVQVGRDGVYDQFDAVSIKLLPNIGPVSLAARLQLVPTLIYLFFGRLPPQAGAPVQHQTINAGPGDGDIVLPGADGGEYVNGGETDEPEGLDLIDRTEPDGVPIFKDLYAVGEEAGTIVDTLLEQLGAFLKSAGSVEQVLAVYTKNDETMQFLKDFGDDQDKADLKSLLDQAKERLTRAAAPPAMTRIPQRRVRAGAH
ncbi:MAG: hypothetical protein WC829_06895 [Hyphomicrobium sp.]|jgi:hypothetical protein